MSKSIDRLTLLATFARIAERGSISAAARDIGLSQASASRQLAELEARLGVQLVQRTTHALSLTEAGQEALRDARGLLDGWEALTEAFADDADVLRGPLKVVAPVALGQMRLAEAAVRFQATHPGVTVTWLLDDEEIRFAEIGCDLWIKAGYPKDERLIAKPLGQVERLIAVAPRLISGMKGLSLCQMADLPCVALGPFEGHRVPLKRKNGDVETLVGTPVMTTNNIFTARKAAQMGIGFAVMPKWFIAEDLKTGALVDALPEWRAPSLTITASYLPARRQPQRLQQFYAHIASAISDMVGIDPMGANE